MHFFIYNPYSIVKETRDREDRRCTQWIVGSVDTREERGCAVIGGADRDRTDDPLVANQVLSQLSYRPEGTTRLQVSGFFRTPQGIIS